MKKILYIICFLLLCGATYALTPTPTITPTSVPTRNVTLNTSTGVFNNGVLYGVIVTATAKEYTDNIDLIKNFHLIQIPSSDRSAWLIVVMGTQAQITAVRTRWNVINTAKEAQTIAQFSTYAYIKQRVIEYYREFTQ